MGFLRKLVDPRLVCNDHVVRVNKSFPSEEAKEAQMKYRGMKGARW